MNSNDGDLVRELGRVIGEREKHISRLQFAMSKIVGLNVLANFIVVIGGWKDMISSNVGPYYLYAMLSFTAAVITFFSMILVDCLRHCENQDEDIEKLESRKRAHPELVHIHAKGGVVPRLFCFAMLMLLVLPNFVIDFRANAHCLWHFAW